VRNSSLVEWTCADNSRGSSVVPKRRTDFFSVVGELSILGMKRKAASWRGLYRSENAGMSNERGVKNTSAVSLRVPGQG
jgi:hypothetical protein